MSCNNVQGTHTPWGAGAPEPPLARLPAAGEVKLRQGTTNRIPYSKEGLDPSRCTYKTQTQVDVVGWRRTKPVFTGISG